MLPLPTDDKARKRFEMWKYLTEYFPDSFMAEVEVAIRGNEQHNPGEELHWAREKSTKQLECAFHHMWDHKAGTVKDTDGQYHLAKAIWRLKAELQLVIETEKGLQSIDLPKETPNGQTDCENTQCNSEQKLRTSGAAVSNRRQKSRPERPFPSEPEWDGFREGGSTREGPQQIPKYGI